MDFLFRARIWLRYRRVAKTRHGIHSPFMYRLVDECLMQKSRGHNAIARIAKKLALFFDEQGWLEWTFRNGKLSAIATSLSIAADDKLKINKIVVLPHEPTFWKEALQHATSRSATVIVAPGIYKNKTSAGAWQTLKALPEFSASADLYEVGLLIREPAIREKEHFVLRWR